jgi:HAD superfamily hydrolase (TIGR01509 family)
MQILKAIFFDMDGTIIDTERDGHRVAFNEAFKQCGIAAVWDVAQYHRLLQIAGGKERMKFFFENEGKDCLPAGKPLDELVQQLHLLKTDIFISLIENGKLPLRPGILRIMKEATANGIQVAICSTSNEKAVKTIANSLLGDIQIDLILAGDVVSRKKPNPEIYLMALQKTGLSSSEVLVVEDSENGVIAGKEAGIRVLATVNEYTRNENLSRADAVVSSFGNETEEAEILTGDLKLADGKMIHLGDLLKLYN